jgi:Tol biopolymer transport system component
MTGGHYTVAPPRQYAVVAMSPDGQRVILVKKNFEFNEHYLANADGTNIHRPLDDHIPRRALLWSPDSQHIAFVSSDHKKDVLCVMNADWTNVRQLGDIKFEGGFVWSPDSQYLAFEGLKDGQSAIFVNNAYGTDHRHLASFDLGPDKGRLFTQTPSWSPNSQHLVFNTWQDGSMHLYRIAADGTQHQHLTPDTPTLAMVYDLAWGPNTDQNEGTR